MSDSFLDHLSTHEREKIRKRMRSPEAYERLREKVKGPEDLEREMEKNAESADLSLSLETEPGTQEKAKDIVRSAIAEQGIDGVLDKAPGSAAEAIQSANFDVTIDHTQKGPKISVRVKTSSDASMGTIQETIPLKATLQKTIMARLKKIS